MYENKKKTLYYNLKIDYYIITIIMKTKVFISRPDEGWSELEIPQEYRKLSYEKMVSRIHVYLKKYPYKGLLITENPSPFRMKKT